MFKLALTAGHYMGTPGKRCLKSIDPNQTREWWLNDRIADKIEKLLAEYDGITILRTDDTSGKNDISLAKRVTEANRFNADFYLSIHHNAGVKGGKGGGIVTYCCKNCSTESRKWQSALYDELIAQTKLKGNRSTVLGYKDYYEVKKTNMPAVLLELGFMDSTTDTPIILTDDFATKCAKACVKIIVERAGLKKKEIAPAPTPAATKVLKKGSKGDDVRRLQNLLNLLGYNCGNADGDFGAKTETAVKAFQKALKQTEDGKFGKNSFAAMKRALTSTKISLNKKSNAAQVTALQNIISDYGYKCTADGSYGPKTEAAVKQYQKSRGLTQDGKAGPKTIGTFVDYLAL